MISLEPPSALSLKFIVFESACGRFSLYYFDWQDAVHTQNLDVFGQLWILLPDTRHWCTPEDCSSGHNTFRIFKDAFHLSCITFSSASWFCRQFLLCSMWTASYGQLARAILLYKQSQLYWTDVQVHWPVYQFWLYGGNTVMACPWRVVWYWLGKRVESIIIWQYTAKYMWSSSSKQPVMSGLVISTSSITTDTSFRRNWHLPSIQKYWIMFTQECNSRFQNSQLTIAIMYTNWRRLRKWS